MKKILGLVVFSLAVPALGAGVAGEYLEVRTADVFTGPCVANGEVNLTGKEAILAWRVAEGEWNGVKLSGLSVVAVVQSGSTLGDPFAVDRASRAVLVVDEQASQVQRNALTQLARAMAPDLLSEIVRVDAAPVQMSFGHHGEASLRAGEIAQIQTRGLHHGDHLCGNEIVYYPPLADADAQPAYTQVHRYQGEGLGTTWSSPFKRSAFVGTFSR